MSTRLPAITPAEARAITRDAYIYGFPIVDAYGIQHSYFEDRDNPEFKGPWNRVHHTARAYTPDDTGIPTPNSDTPFSYVGADLRTEPLVLTMPAVEDGRYYAVQFVDMYTFNIAYVGTRTTGNGEGRFLLAGPNWRGNVPAGITKVIRSETEFVFVRYRTQLFTPDDIENVRRIQRGYTVETLSEHLGLPAPPARPRVKLARPLGPAQVRTSIEFFNLLNVLLQFCPTHPSEDVLMARFARFGIGAGLVFDGRRLPRETRSAVEDGIADAWQSNAAITKDVVDGKLSPGALFGTRQQLRNDYRYRMAGAARRLFGNSTEEAYSSIYFRDSAGQWLDATDNRYVLRFAPGQLPPVDAFWSLTLYELRSQRLSANPLNRYLINSRMLPSLRRDADGGLTLRIQHESPGKDRESNWLPAPKGPVKVGLRLYRPRPEAQNGTWKAPPVERAG